MNSNNEDEQFMKKDKFDNLIQIDSKVHSIIFSNKAEHMILFAESKIYQLEVKTKTLITHN